MDRTQFEAQERLHEIHDLLDSSSSINSVGKSFDFTVDQVKQAIAKLHSLVAQTDFRSKEQLQACTEEIRDLKNAN